MTVNFALEIPETMQFPLVVKIVVLILAILTVIMVAAYDKMLELLGRAIKSVFAPLTRRGKKGA